ncbi:MAG: hypothetical protein LT103_12575 [Burkholderiaceae bacterium]|nr:hypothetical protein [Burkholderiaceae bacterium]
MIRWTQILYYSARIAYLESVHRRVLQVAPHHEEASATWLELQHARDEFALAWGPRDFAHSRRPA